MSRGEIKELAQGVYGAAELLVRKGAPANAEMVRQAAQALTALLAENERLRGELAEARGWAEGWRSAVDTACTLLGLNNGLGASEFTVRVQRLSVALGEAERALEPFAVTGAVLDGKPKDEAVWAGQTPAPPITFGHLRNAAAALSALKPLLEKNDG